MLSQGQNKQIKYPLVSHSLSKIIEPVRLNSPSLIPYTLIRYMATNNWDEYIRAANLLIDRENRCNDNTSCVHTAYAVCILFFGKEVAKEQWNILPSTLSTEFDIILNSGKRIPYQTENFFGDFYVHEMNRLAHSVLQPAIKRKKAIAAARPQFVLYLNSITAYVDEKLSHESDDSAATLLNEHLSKPHYDFNKHCLQRLKDEMMEKSPVNLNKSYVYWIAITKFRQGVSFYQHAFVIEKFFSAQYKDVRFRLYQSFIREATLLDDFTKNQYSDKEENTWGEDKLTLFLDNLKKFYCINDQTLALEVNNCFGYEINHRLLHLNKNVITGPNIRYYSRSITPTDCVKNLALFIMSHPALKLAFQIKISENKMQDRAPVKFYTLSRSPHVLFSPKKSKRDKREGEKLDIINVYKRPKRA